MKISYLNFYFVQNCAAPTTLFCHFVRKELPSTYFWSAMKIFYEFGDTKGVLTIKVLLLENNKT